MRAAARRCAASRRRRAPRRRAARLRRTRGRWRSAGDRGAPARKRIERRATDGDGVRSLYFVQPKCLRDAGSYCAYSGFRNELHGNSGLRVDHFQVIDQLCQVLDRINVVVWRRRDKSNTGDGMPNARDHLVNFVTRQLSTLAGLGSLRDLDLQVARVHQIIGGHAEARRGYLLDCAPPQIAVGIGLVACLVLAAFTGIRAATDTVHGDRQSFMRLLADGAEGHRAGGEPLYDPGGRFDLFQRNRRTCRF